LGITNHPALGIIFLTLIIFSRIGLYGFEVGEITIIQYGVEENIRGEISSVESSLTSLASLAIFVAGYIIREPSNFIWLVWGSVIFISTGALLYAAWCSIWVLILKGTGGYKVNEESNLIETSNLMTPQIQIFKRNQNEGNNDV